MLPKAVADRPANLSSTPMNFATASKLRRCLPVAAVGCGVALGVNETSHGQYVRQQLSGIVPIAYDVSPNGSIVVGKSRDPQGSSSKATWWNRQTGTMHQLPGVDAYAYGISADGSTIVGEMYYPSDQRYRPVWWNRASNTMQALANCFTSPPPYTGGGRALGASSNGSIIVGASTCPNESGAYWERATNTLRYVGVLAYGMSADSSIITGRKSDLAINQFVPAWWNRLTGTIGYLQTLGYAGVANGATPDGAILFGRVREEFAVVWHPSWWTRNNGSLNLLPRLGGQDAEVNDANADGSLFVGFADDAQQVMRAVCWNRTAGTVDVLPGSTSEAVAVSSRGMTIVGGDSIWIRQCPADIDRNNYVDGTDLGTLLSQWSSTGSADLNEDGVVNGADIGILLGNWGPCLN